MRWGIQSAASSSHSTVDMCLDELDICCRLSMATNCVVSSMMHLSFPTGFFSSKIFLSHRYGSRLVPACIAESVFQSLLASLISQREEKQFLSEMYQLDENDLDRNYCLRPNDDAEQWSSLEKRLQMILRRAADACYAQGTLTGDERNEFHISGRDMPKQRSRWMFLF